MTCHDYSLGSWTTSEKKVVRSGASGVLSLPSDVGRGIHLPLYINHHRILVPLDMIVAVLFPHLTGLGIRDGWILE